MFVEDPNDLDDIERMIKFNDLAEEFGRPIAAWETSPWVTEFELLERDGIKPPAPAELDDDQVTQWLWKVIENLATRNTFFYQTDHLSDRQFYEQLWHEVLHEPTKDYSTVLDKNELTSPNAWSHHIDMCDPQVDPTDYWRYYADDRTRREDAGYYPDVPMPPREPCPYDRDRFLPKSPDERMMETGDDTRWDGPDDPAP